MSGIWDVTIPQNLSVPDVRTQYIADKSLFNTFFFNEHDSYGTHDYRMLQLPILSGGNDIGGGSVTGANKDIGYENQYNDFWINNPNTNYRVPIKSILTSQSGTLGSYYSTWTYSFTAKANHRYMTLFIVNIEGQWNNSDLTDYQINIFKNDFIIYTLHLHPSMKGVGYYPTGSTAYVISTINVEDICIYSVDTVVTYSITPNFFNLSIGSSNYTVIVMEI
jgi:hypothetical protein